MPSKPADQRTRQANYQSRCLAIGDCPRCGQEPRDYNRRTGKPHALGPACRAKKARTQKLLMQRRRATAG